MVEVLLYSYDLNSSKCPFQVQVLLTSSSCVRVRLIDVPAAGRTTTST